MISALSALDRLADESPQTGGWIATGDIADAVGCSAGDAAATLRSAAERGLCRARRSLVDGTAWRLTPIGTLVAAKERRPRSAAR